jgi:transposase
MEGRQIRGMQIAAGGGLVPGEGHHLWSVPSQSERRKYRVDPIADRCDCPDHAATNLRCKHLWAVAFTMTAEVKPDGTTTLTETTRVTYSQDWAAYNAAQVEEKDTFLTLLADLCRTVPEPPQGRGRPRLPLSDMVFATTFKVFSRFSSRRFSSDLREAEARGLISRVPHFNSVSNYMASPGLTPVLHELISASSLPLRAVESDFAVDSSGFSTSRFDQWLDFKYGTPKPARSRHWLKAHLMVGVTTNVVTAVEISKWNSADTRHFAPLVEATASNFQIEQVSADKAYLSHKNVELVEKVGGTPFIPFKRRNAAPLAVDAWGRMYHQFALNREEFMRHYHKRSNVESAFSMIKGKFGDSVLSKSIEGQANEVLCKVLAHNIVVVGQAMHEFGIEPIFTPAI